MAVTKTAIAKVGSGRLRLFPKNSPNPLLATSAVNRLVQTDDSESNRAEYCVGQALGVEPAVDRVQMVVDRLLRNAERAGDLLGRLAIGNSLQDLNLAFAQQRTVRARSRICLLYTSPSPRDATLSRMPSSA